MTAERAMKRFAARYKNLTIVRCIDYDADSFIVCAVHDPYGNKEMDPFFSIDKNDGSIEAFSPMTNLPKFANALRNKTVYEFKEG